MTRWLVASAIVLACSAEPANDATSCTLEPDATCADYAQAECQCEQWTERDACERAECIWFTQPTGEALCRSWCDLYE